MVGPKDWFKEKVTGTPVTQQPKVQPVNQPRNDFQWDSDIGTTSIEGIKALQRSSGITLSVVSSYRPGDPGLHGQMNAVDFVGSAQAMAQVSAYLYQYSEFLLELIHTDYTAPGGGWYAKNGKRVPQSFYDGPDITTGGNIIRGHVDHIHVATTMSALVAASRSKEDLLKRLNQQRIWQKMTGNSGEVGKDPGTAPGSSKVGGEPGKPKGCLIPVTTTTAALLGFLSTLIYFFM